MTCEICQAQEKLYRYKGADNKVIYICAGCFAELIAENRNRYEFKKTLKKTMKEGK